MSVILTIASLGTRVALAYLLSATPLGVTGIWLSVPIGWSLADAILQNLICVFSAEGFIATNTWQRSPGV